VPGEVDRLLRLAFALSWCELGWSFGEDAGLEVKGGPAEPGLRPFRFIRGTQQVHRWSGSRAALVDRDRNPVWKSRPKWTMMKSSNWNLSIEHVRNGSGSTCRSHDGCDQA